MDWRENVTESSSHFKKIYYTELNARQKELFNFQKIAATLADFGFNCIKLADDWLGADFIAYHLSGTTTLKVQLKSRLTISQKYFGKDKDIWIAFPYGEPKSWYLIQHDCLVDKIRTHTKWLNSDSWKKGAYSSTSINPDLLKSLAEDKLGPVYGPVLDVKDS
jgi:hypothetical protein